MPLKTETVILDHWKGLNTFTDETDADPHFLAACENVDFDEDGVARKRRGVVQVTGLGLSGRINWIYDFQSQQGFTSSTDRLRVLIVSGSTLHVIRSFHQAGQVFSATFAATNALHYGASSNNGACYISNENGGAAPKLLCYTGGAWVYRSSELDGPAAAPAVTTGSTGTPSGAYKVRYTYEDIFGNESNPSPVSATISVTIMDVAVGVIASADATVSIINLYVLPPNGSIYQFSRTSSNATATISHTVSDATVLAGDEVSLDHYPAPKAKYVAIYGDMLVLGGDASLPDAIFPSDFQFHRQFNPDKNVARAVSGDGQPLKGFGKLFEDLVIGKADSLFLADGTDATVFNCHLHDPEYGVLGQPSMAFAARRFVFFSDDGVYGDASTGPEEISQRIRKTLRSLNPANLAAVPPKQYCANYKYYKQLFWSCRETTGAGENDTILVYNYEQDFWTKYKGISAVCLGTVQVDDDYEWLYGGDASGNVFKFAAPNDGSANADNVSGSPVAISAFIETPWLHLPKIKGYPDWETMRTEPRYIKIYAGGEPASGSFITLQTIFYTDFSTTVRGTYSTTHNAAAYPTLSVDPKKIGSAPGGQTLGTFNWIKLRISNATLNEHFRIFKIIFKFKAKPAID
jgi:hypothetical protein